MNTITCTRCREVMRFYALGWRLTAKPVSKRKALNMAILWRDGPCFCKGKARL